MESARCTSAPGTTRLRNPFCRLDAGGHPHVIELNTYPGLGKDFSYFPRLAQAAGYTYDALINRLVAIAKEPKGFN